MEMQDAIQVARTYILELHDIENLSLEEAMFDRKSGEWQIVFGLPFRQFLDELFGGARPYKRVYVNDKTGTITALTAG